MALCECGCGQDAGVYSDTNRKRGKPKRFINGHASKGKTRKTHCIRGHLRTPETLYPNGTCKICHADGASKTKQWAKTESGRLSSKKTFLKLQYGVTLQELDERLAKQNYCCAICEVLLDSSCLNLTPQVDHVHTENELRFSVKKIRGLLCGSCNRGLGQFKDNIATMEKAVLYLKETQ